MSASGLTPIGNNDLTAHHVRGQRGANLMKKVISAVPAAAVTEARRALATYGATQSIQPASSASTRPQNGFQSVLQNVEASNSASRAFPSK